jgi:hypothetical protein
VTGPRGKHGSMQKHRGRKDYRWTGGAGDGDRSGPAAGRAGCCCPSWENEGGRRGDTCAILAILISYLAVAADAAASFYKVCIYIDMNAGINRAIEVVLHC